ncbi:hypothetical protein Thiowin_01818 [Thiorhodovibrio winogradskyi]|uniref:Immunity protein 30 domain-containing protein n=1 Tax=Thiorhodovibrio winogradskyi TaxID=77007 RepID=A0ABZ0S9T2_9GAMM|nr:hypothetical protein [Thiorhodovibrio winogradskyi]
MNLNEMLDLAFEQFISNTLTEELLKSIKSSVTSADVDTLIIKIESLDDPSAYCKNDLDSKTPAGFFLFLDFISALIINFGHSAIQETDKYSNSKHPFVPWVVKYASDERFHNEIISKFSNLFAK